MSLPTKLIFLYFLICFFFQKNLAQDLPPVSIFTTEDYKADNQNWAITQTEDKTMFFANSKGLLKYDGESWKLYGSGNNTILRSVYAIGNDVYTGAYMEFGVWKLDENNIYTYYSLSENLDLADDEQFWNITNYNDYIIFQSLDTIYMYHLKKKEFRIIKSESKYTKIVIVNDSLYLHERDKGLFKLLDGIKTPINTSELLKKSILINIYSISNELYAQTQFNGIIRLTDNKEYIPSFDNINYSDVSVYSSIQLSNGDIFLGTISNGLLKISNDKLILNLNQENALSNNTILNIFKDFNDNIWIGLDNGINCINIDSNITIYNDNKGELGTIYSSILFRDKLYLGTNQGLFIFDNNQNTYNLVRGTAGQVWTLFEYNGELFCGHNNGSFLINDNTAQAIEGPEGTWIFRVIDDNTIMTGNYQGLHILVRDSETGWKYDRQLEGFDFSSQYLEFISKHEAIINHEYKGLFKLRFDAGFKKVLSITKDTIVDKGLNSSIVKLNNKVLYAYKKGIFQYNKNADTFEIDSTLSKLYFPTNYSSGKLVKTKDNKLWIFNKTDIVHVSLGLAKNDYTIKTIPIAEDYRNQISGYENVSLIGDNTYLIGRNDGYLKIVNPSLINFETKTFLQNITAKDLDNNILTGLHLINDLSLENSFNNMSFSLSSNNYSTLYKTEYQYKLIGYDNEWLDWENSGKQTYNNLPFGSYTFKFRSRVGQKYVSDPVEYDFEILRPFYLSTIFIILYAVAFLLIILLIHTLYKSSYNRKKSDLKKESKRKLEMQELENQRQVMKLNNDKLKLQVENKNRELAISTMSLVKKNEFLSKIKSDLKPLESHNKIIKKVIRIVDSNINSEDDWKFFEEAFNNADKDFFKKLKVKHPSLTPNELKLCAYLRLNLSSKEIAPLFNISPKSVEIKRYRLRKKMDLERDINLLDYILTI